MTESVVTLVAQKLAVSADEAEGLLSAYARALRARVEREGRVTVHGLGVFVRRDGQLTLEADAALLDAAWAGLDTLQTVEVLAADEPAPDPVIETDSAQAEGVTGEEAEAEETSKEGAVSTRSAHGKAVKPPRKRRPIFWPIATATAFVLGAGFMWIFGPWLLDSTSPPSQGAYDRADTVVTSGIDESLATAAASDTELSLTEEEPVMPPGAQVTTLPNGGAESEPDPQQPVTAFPRLDREAGGYTLIVGSFEASDRAAREVARMKTLLGNQDVPVDVMRDGPLFRTAVGQEPTIEGALALKERLSVLPADTWVLRIRANS